MATPPKGDVTGVPLNKEGRDAANAWDPAKDEAAGEQCKAYGVGGLMRMPTRLHITWQDDNTLKIDTDAGTQTRLLNFAGPQGQGGDWQGVSVASWDRQLGLMGAGRGGPPPGGSLKVVTTKMKPGYLRKNGVPYSENAVLTEFFDRVEFDGVPYLILTTVVDDPRFLSDTFITSEQFKLEADGSKWNPTPCKAR